MFVMPQDPRQQVLEQGLASFINRQNTIGLLKQQEAQYNDQFNPVPAAPQQGLLNNVQTGIKPASSYSFGTPAAQPATQVGQGSTFFDSPTYNVNWQNQAGTQAQMPTPQPVQVAPAKAFNPYSYQIEMVKNGASLEQARQMAQEFQDRQKEGTFNKYLAEFKSATDPQLRAKAAVNMYLTDSKRVPFEAIKGMAGVQHKEVDNGGGIYDISYDSFGNRVGSASLIVPKQVDPNHALSANTQLTINGQNTATQKEIAALHENAQNIRQQLQLAHQGQLQEKDLMLNAYKVLAGEAAWSKNPLNAGQESPYADMVPWAKSMLQGKGQVPPGGAQPSNSDPIGAWIDKARATGASPEQIKQTLRERGYGDAYDSWIW